MFETLRYPLSGDAAVRTLTVGICLSALGVLVLPAVLVAGYYGRVLASSSTGRSRPPRFDGWGALFVQGLKTWTVVAAYLIVGVILLVVLGVTALVLGDVGSGAGAWVGALALLVAALLLLGVFMLPAWFFFPAALIHVGRTDSVAAAFDVRTIGRIVTDRRYLKGWAAGVAVIVLGTVGYGVTGGFGGMLTALFAPTAAEGGLGLVGHVIGVAINFYCQIVAFRFMGRGYGAAIDTADDTGESSSEGDTELEYVGWGAEAHAWRERRRTERGDQVD